jgi:dienelactone hydrolase
VRRCLTALSAAVVTITSFVLAPVVAASAADAPIRARYGVGTRVLALEDTSRRTPADPKGQRRVRAATSRALPTTIYYPTAGSPSGDPFTGGAPAAAGAVPAPGRFPVILFSHGSPGTPLDYHWMLERWASEGYVVVAPTYPVSSRSGPDKVSLADQREQVRDARFVLDRLLALARGPSAAGGLGGAIDPRHVAAVGHSLGGFTALALVSDCCRDRRVDAAVVLAGVAVNAGGPALRHPAGPILFAHAPLDIAVPYEHSRFSFRHAGRPKYLLEVDLPIGGVASHVLPFVPAGGAVATGVAHVVDDFLARYLGRDRSAGARIAADARAGRFLRLHTGP